MNSEDKAHRVGRLIDSLCYAHALLQQPDGIIYEDDDVRVVCEDHEYRMLLKKALEVKDPRYNMEIKGFGG